ncbi:hypothetical protein MPDQ_006949 [Monascus purpureus]|uniref:Uncharacterized protein n=1 Tax=Monascus purpureus TaxID=5098 RepID=A0A507QV55_MONPU|nr:hypothetical protein MPDQ_006949 [Monascus purpureus]
MTGRKHCSYFSSSSFERTENSLTVALEWERSQWASVAPQPRDSEQQVSPLMMSAPAVEFGEMRETSNVNPHRRTSSQYEPGGINQSNPRQVSISSESRVSEQSETSTHITSPSVPPRTRHTAMSQAASPGLFRDIVSKIFSSEFGQGDSYSGSSTEQTSIMSRDTSSADLDHSNLIQALANARIRAQQVRIQEQLLRPLRIEPQDNFHRPNADLKMRFDASACLELTVRRLNIRDWLRVGV